MTQTMNLLEKASPKCYKCPRDAEEECGCGNYFCSDHGERDSYGDMTCDECIDQEELEREIQDSIDDEEYMT